MTSPSLVASGDAAEKKKKDGGGGRANGNQDLLSSWSCDKKSLSGDPTNREGTWERFGGKRNGGRLFSTRGCWVSMVVNTPPPVVYLRRLRGWPAGGGGRWKSMESVFYL